MEGEQMDNYVKQEDLVEDLWETWRKRTQSRLFCCG